MSSPRVSFLRTVATVYLLGVLATVCISITTKLLVEMTWRLPAGVFCVASGIVTVQAARKFLPSHRDRFLRYSVILSPSSSMIFAGLNLFTWDVAWLKTVFDLTVLFAVLCFFLGTYLLLRHKKPGSEVRDCGSSLPG